MSEVIENNTPNTEGSPAPENNGAPAEKTFTQAELDTIVARRLAKAQKGMPSDEELTEFRAWKNSQQTEQEKWNALQSERDTAKKDLSEALAKIEQYEHERYLLSKGVNAEDVDYYAFKVAKLVNENKTFEEAADEFIAARKPNAGQTENARRVDFGAPLNGGKPSMTVDEIMAVQDDAKRQALIAQHHTLFGF